MLTPFEEKLIRKSGLFWEWPADFGKQAIHYIEEGKGDEHVLLLHGFAAHTYTWINQIPFLVDEGYHVWALDYIGFGLSDKPLISYRFNHFLDLIQAFMQAKKIPHAHVIGNSMGGSLALGLALTCSQRVNSLILLDAVAYPLKLPFLVDLGKFGGQLLFPFINELTIKMFLKQIVFDPMSINEEQIQAYLLPYHLKGGKEALVEMTTSFDFQTMMQLNQNLSKINQPTLIIWGENDTFVPVSQFYQLTQAMPEAEPSLISHAGHIPQEEQPDYVNQKVASFLKRLKL
jgi:pimeloyl-ACP methyl ester carboxylesterase